MSYLNDKGYCIIAKRNGVVILGHRLMMERIIKRKLRPEEWIHHKDGRRWNNCPFNLELMSQSEHTRQHNKTRTYRLPKQYSDADLIQMFVNRWLELGRKPFRAELIRPNFITYYKRIGSFKKIAKLAIDHAAKVGQQLP